MTPRLILNEGLIPSPIDLRQISVTDHCGKNSADWLINLLKKEEVYEPRFKEEVCIYEIINGPLDIYEYLSERKSRGIIKAQPLLAFCFAMKERYRSQRDNIYYCLLNEGDNKLFLKIEINEKIMIQYFPFGKNFLKKSESKRNLLLKAI